MRGVVLRFERGEVSWVRIYCIRHGETEDNARDIKGRRSARLSEKGLEQARELARRLEREGVKFDRVFSSPLLRALETAAEIAGSMGLEKMPRPGLSARNLGELTGCGGDIFRDWMKREDWESRPSDGESLLDLEARVVGELDPIKECHAGEKVLLVVHQGVLRVLDHAYGEVAGDDAMAKEGYLPCTVCEYEI